MQIRIEEAYATACQKIGEGLVRESVMADEVERLQNEVQTLKDMLDGKEIVDKATEIVGEGAVDQDHEQG